MCASLQDRIDLVIPMSVVTSVSTFYGDNCCVLDVLWGQPI